MNVKLYSLYDAKAQLFGAPNLFQNDATAVRAMYSFAQQSGTTVHDYPDDFSVFCLGTFDDGSGHIASETPRFLATIASLNAQFSKSPSDGNGHLHNL